MARGERGPGPLEHRVRVVRLFDLYSPLLTPRQQQLVSHYYCEDLSLGEIAAAAGVSRQAVFYGLRRCVRIMEDYEHALGLMAAGEQRRALLDELRLELQRARAVAGSGADAHLEQALHLIEAAGSIPPLPPGERAAAGDGRSVGSRPVDGGGPEGVDPGV